MRYSTVVGVSILLVSVAGCASGAPRCEGEPQSPRLIDRQAVPSPYDAVSTESIVRVIDEKTVAYRPRGSNQIYRLEWCGQHYHGGAENRQGCPGEGASVGAGDPGPGDLVEFHTVFAAEVRDDGCDPETLDCCAAAPFLVRAFVARITPGGEPGPIEIPTARPLAEWSGSTTGAEDEPDECKPAAQWSFHLGCDETVSEGQLSLFRHVDPVRRLQSGPRVSRDLTLVEDPRP